MAASFFEDVKRSISAYLPRDMLSSRYAPLQGSSSSDGGAGGSSPGAFSRTSLRDCLFSKSFVRIALVVVGLLLLGDMLLRTPANGMLDKYGWNIARLGQVDNLQKVVDSSGIDWSHFAYCQYVTTEAYLCNSLMIFESLKRVGARADRVMMFPKAWDLDSYNSSAPDYNAEIHRLLLKAQAEYDVQLVPIEVQHFSGESTWADSFTKLLAFNQTQYQRVLSLDSDATVLQPMDELFLLPRAPVAMPRAYWLENGQLSSQVVLVEPSEFEFERIVTAMNTKNESEYDMEIVNDLYAKDCLILPHRKYDLLTGEFKSESHRAYMGSDQENWDPDRVLKEAKFVHFSDWPMPKPWQSHSEVQSKEAMPPCRPASSSSAGKEDCRDQMAWKSVYQDFLDRRKKVCGAHFMPVNVGA